MRRRALLGVSIYQEQIQNNNVIYYTSTRNMVETPYDKNVFGTNLLSNTYLDGVGIMTFDGDVTSIGEKAFYGGTSIKSIIIPSSVTDIGYMAFYSCTGLESITIPNSVKSTGTLAFGRCSSLASAYIGKNITSRGESMFAYCSSLHTVIISDGTTSIQKSEFYKCTSLTSVTIPDSVTSIGKAAFDGCSILTSVYCKPTTPPTLGGSNVFNSNTSGRRIYVPTGSVNAYKSATYWSKYASDIEGVVYDF
jgi:hypothetical protein